MNARYPARMPAPARLVTDRTPVSPCHLPAMTDAAADLPDGVAVRIVNPVPLGSCEDCGVHGDGALDPQPAIATVVGYDPYGFRCLVVVCSLHLDGAVRGFARREYPVVVEVPTCSRRWFLRDERETFYALDESRGIGVTRTYASGVWAAWDVHNAGDGTPSRVEVLRTFPNDRGDEQARLDAECWAQSHAARIAADAYEAASVDTAALPVVTVSGVAA